MQNCDCGHSSITDIFSFPLKTKILCQIYKELTPPLPAPLHPTRLKPPPPLPPDPQVTGGGGKGSDQQNQQPGVTLVRAGAQRKEVHGKFRKMRYGKSIFNPLIFDDASARFNIFSLYGKLVFPAYSIAICEVLFGRANIRLCILKCLPFREKKTVD